AMSSARCLSRPPPTTEVYTLSLHDALPISEASCALSDAFSASSASCVLLSIPLGVMAGAWPTASEYLRYVSIEATTTRASTVIRSMPTRETRTQASITMPLSSTRSRTSMRLVPPDARSTGMVFPPRLPSVVARGQLAPCTRRPPAEGFDLALQQPHLFTQPFVFQLVLVVAGREVMIVAPPIRSEERRVGKECRW